MNGRITLKGKVTSLCISSDLSETIVGSAEGLMYRMRNSDMKTVKISESHRGAITAVTFPRDSSDRFATCSVDGSMVVWDLTDYHILCSGKCRDGGIPTCISYAFDCIISGWTDGKVRCFDGETGEMLWDISDVHKGGVTALQVSYNQRFMITGGENGDIRVWDIKSREMVSHLKEHTSAITSISIFEDDAHALTGSKDRNILCWDLRHEKRVASLRQRMGGINSFALLPDQLQVVSVGQERKLSFWDLREPDPIQSIALEGEALALSISSSGNFIVTGGKSQVLQLWLFEGGNRLADGMGHSGSINSVAFSPDDKQIVSVGEDGCIFVWNVYT
mmetsp:Transcript_19003/g.62471  ORF Transcript_19003/g.62471 Transcript_19003/m.62471 type:complete len:334 (-) Transcript_19003:1244-2245(-)